MAIELINDSDFETRIKDSEKVVVKYFADWCGSCKLFAPKYKRLSGDAQYDGITFLDVNAEENPIARKKVGVTNLPYFAIFKNGDLIDAVSSSKEEALTELLQKLK